MSNQFNIFKKIAIKSAELSAPKVEQVEVSHPFEVRDIHPCLPKDVRKLFDNGHFSQATFEAFKFIDKEVARLASVGDSGLKLMMSVFDEEKPIIKLTPCLTISEKDEQKGFRHLFAGSMLAIRNPRGHEYAVHDTPDECLDHLALASILLRRLEAGGFVITVP